LFPRRRFFSETLPFGPCLATQSAGLYEALRLPLSRLNWEPTFFKLIIQQGLQESVASSGLSDRQLLALRRAVSPQQAPSELTALVHPVEGNFLP